MPSPQAMYRFIEEEDRRDRARRRYATLLRALGVLALFGVFVVPNPRIW